MLFIMMPKGRLIRALRVTSPKSLRERVLLNESEQPIQIVFPNIERFAIFQQGSI